MWCDIIGSAWPLSSHHLAAEVACRQGLCKQLGRHAVSPADAASAYFNSLLLATTPDKCHLEAAAAQLQVDEAKRC